MKRTSLIAALIAGSTVFGGQFVHAEDRLLQKHHQRFKQRLNPTQNSRSIPAPMPSHESNAGSVVPTEPIEPSQQSDSESGSTTPPSQTQPPMVGPEVSDSTLDSQPTPSLDTFPDSLPEGRFTSNIGLDTGGLASGGRTGSPLSGPLNTIGDFFAPGNSTFVIGPQVLQGSYQMTNQTGAFPTRFINSDGRLGFNNLSYVSIDGRTPAYTGIGGGSARDFVSLQDGLPPGSNPSTAILFNNPVNQAAVNQLIEAIYGSGTASVQGDFVATLQQVDQYGDGEYSLDQGYVIAIPTSGSEPATVFLSAPGSQLGRTKLTEQNSPIPRDRFFFDYSFFSNAAVSQSSTDVHRFAPGFEKCPSMVTIGCRRGSRA